MSPRVGHFPPLLALTPRHFTYVFVPSPGNFPMFLNGLEWGKGTAGIDWCIVTVPNFLLLLPNVETLGPSITNLAL